MANTINKYDSPNFTLLRETTIHSAQAAASTAPFAHFKSRNKCVVTTVSVRLVSAASAAAGSIHCARLRNTPSNTSVQTLKTNTMVSATSAGTVWTYTLTTNNTLTSLHDSMVLVTTGACDKGKFSVIYEYFLLPPVTLTL